MRTLTVHNAAAGVVYTLTVMFVSPSASGQVLNESVKLLASDGATGDQFGISASVSGDVAVVGARWDDDNGTDSGSAYVSRLNGSSWVPEQKLLPSDGAAFDEFGHHVSVSGDVAVVGASGAWWVTDSGSAYVFRWNGSSWVQEQKLLALDGEAGDLFGRSVSVSGDVAVVGSFRDDDNGTDSGSAYVFNIFSDPVPLIVRIDIKPGSTTNSIQLGSWGLVPVAILTTEEFDARDVNPDTVRLAGSSVAIRGNGSRLLASLTDVDGDGDLDLMLHVSTENLELSHEATEPRSDEGTENTWTTVATLTGKTWDGEAIEGADTVNIVPP